MKESKNGKPTSGRFPWGWSKKDQVFDDWLVIKALHDEEHYDLSEIGPMLHIPRSESYVRFVYGLEYNPNTGLLE